MKILVLKGSANVHGSSAMLADAFMNGAKASGHQVTSIDVTRANVHSCLGCIHCGYEGPCAQHDGMTKIKEKRQFWIQICLFLPHRSITMAFRRN